MSKTGFNTVPENWKSTLSHGASVKIAPWLRAHKVRTGTGKGENKKSAGELTTAGETTDLLKRGHSLATSNDRGENVTLHGNTKGERDDIQEEEVRGLGGGGLARQDTSLHGGSVGDSLIGVDGLLELLAVEVVAQELLYPWDTGGATNKDDLVNLALLDTRVLEDLGDWVQSAVESLGVDVLETSTGDLGVEVLAVEEGVDLNGGLGTVGESALGTLASSAKTTESTWVTGQIYS